MPDCIWVVVYVVTAYTSLLMCASASMGTDSHVYADCVHARAWRWRFLPSLYPGFPPRPIKHRAARLQGWLAMGPSLSSSPLRSAHLRFPWLHTTLISLQKCNILCIIVSSYGLSGFILSKALCWLQKKRKKKRRKIKCTVGEFYSKTRCPWKTKHQYLSSGVTRDRCIQCYKKAKQNKKSLNFTSRKFNLKTYRQFAFLWRFGEPAWAHWADCHR